MRTSIFKMLLFSLLLLASFNVFAQMSVSTSATPQNLVQNILSGPGVSVSNITFSGSSSAIGSYSCNGCNLGLSQGVILSSGNCSSAANDASFLGSTDFGLSGDVDLATLSGTTSKDAAVLEFDVFTFFDKLSMKFQFSSEEYDDYVSLGFSDPMAIWISGPGITGNQNIALVPYSTTPVNINTINNGQSWNGVPTGPCMNCAYYHSNYANLDLAYDGYTHIITSNMMVMPGNTYHIKIAISDASDGMFDSALLLGKNTLRSDSSTALPCTGFSVSAGNDTAFCGGPAVLSANPSTPGNYIYSWSPSIGLDDSTLQNPTIITDISNRSYVVTVIDTVNSCTATDTVVASAFLDKTETINICGGFPIMLNAGAGFGITYLWNGGATTPTLTIFSDGLYTCTITNAFGCSITHKFGITDHSFIVDLGPDITGCSLLSVLAQTSIPGAYLYWWTPGGLATELQVYNQPFNSQVISVFVTDTVTGCTATDQMTATIITNSEDTSKVCNLTNPVNLSLPPLSQNILWQYNTDPPTTPITLPDTTPTIAATQQGIYSAFSNQQGCFISNIFHVIDSCFIQTSPNNYYWVGGTGNWNDVSHWATTSGGLVSHATPPADSNDVFFDANSFLSINDTVYGSPLRMDCKSFDASAVNSNATFFFDSDLWVFGSFLLSQFVDWHFNDYLVIYPTTDMNFNTSGINLDYTNIEFFGNANEFVQDDIRTKGTIIADSAGTIYFNNVTVDAESFESNYLITLNLGTSVFNLQSTFGIMDFNGVAIVNGDSSFINVGHLSNGVIGTFQANAGTYNYVNSDNIIGQPTANIMYGTYYDVDYINTKEAHVRERNFENMIWFVNTVSSTSHVGKLIFDQVDTVLFYTKRLNIDTLFFNNPSGICLTNFYDTVFVANQITANSSAGNLITLYDTMTTAGSTFFTTSNSVCLDYMKLKGMIAGGAPNFFAGANSIDLGGNFGWIFAACINLSNVWPGDANYDLIVNNLDFLNLGLAYGFTGPVRSGASLNYVAQPATDWSGFFSTGVNYKHADCNGDGLVDIYDTTAISLNYGQTHPARFSSPELNTINPNISLHIAQDTVGLNETFYLDINLASFANPVDSIYGVAFTLQTDANLIDTSQVSIISYSPSILGNFGNDLFSFEKNFFGNGKVDAAASRINHVNLISTYGTVGRLGIVTTDNIAAREMIHVNVTNGYAVTANGTIVSLNGIGDSVLLDPNYVGINEYSNADGQLIIYPNPSTGLVYLNNGNEFINEIQLTDNKGALLNSWNVKATKTNLDLRKYQTGLYLLSVKCGNSVTHRKVHLVK